MNINQAKASIPCEVFLASVGHRPTHTTQGGKVLWYHSPLREGDNTASFKVDTNLRTWYDFGTDKGGHVVKLVAEYYQDQISDALRRLRTSGLGQSGYPTLPFAQNTSQRRFSTDTVLEKSSRFPKFNKITKTLPLKHPALVQYLRDERKISPEIFLSQDLLEEVHFETPAGKRLFGVGWRSKGGYEVRNSIFKGFIGERKTISHIVEPGAERVYIFGGFINYLSMLQDKKVQSLSGSVITMNGDRLCDETFYEIQKHNYQEVILLADHDESGDSVKAYFTEELPKIDIRLVDGSSLYDGFNDYNDMIRGISLNGKSGR